MYQTWGETEALGVHAQTAASLSSLNLEFQSNGQEQLLTKNLVTGLVAATSYNDFHYQYRGWFLMCGENKGAEGSLLAAVLQVSLTNTHFAMGLLERGLPREKCIVPAVANTGMHMLFGATIIIADSFPTFVPLTESSDLLDASENRYASALFGIPNDHCKRK